MNTIIRTIDSENNTLDTEATVTPIAPIQDNENKNFDGWNYYNYGFEYNENNEYNQFNQFNQFSTSNAGDEFGGFGASDEFDDEFGVLDDWDFDDDNNNDNEVVVRVHELPQMDNTRWFKHIKLYPLNLAEMQYFITQMDTLHLFKEMDILSVENFSAERLDAMFLILKLINLESVAFCEHVIRNFFEKSFNKIFYFMTGNKSYNEIYFEPRCVRAFMDEFYMDMSIFMIRFLTVYRKKIAIGNENIYDNINYITKRMISFINNLLKSECYETVLKEFRIPHDEDFFETHTATFMEITTDITEYVKTTTNQTITKLRKITKYFINNTVRDEDILNMIAILSNIDALSTKKSDAIDNFSNLMTFNMTKEEISKEKIIKIWQYDNFLYTLEHKNSLEKYTISIYDFGGVNFYHNRKRIAIKKAEEYGMKLYPENEINDILMLFVYHKIVDSVDILISLLINLMETGRFEPGIFSQYDDSDLETSYMLISMSNDIINTYDSFLDELVLTRKLNRIYPIEFVLRLISRILNVDIKFYNESMERTNIDNSVYKVYYAPIIIYQLGDSKYYLMHSNLEEFSPISNDFNDDYMSLYESTDQSTNEPTNEFTNDNFDSQIAAEA